jgi:hypothetical protein
VNADLPGEPGMRRPGLRMHPRTRPVGIAEAAIRMRLWEMQEEYDLTDVEMMRVLIGAQQGISKYMLRAERHPGDPERKADEE